MIHISTAQPWQPRRGLQSGEETQALKVKRTERTMVPLCRKVTRFALTHACVPWQNRLVTAGGRAAGETCENLMVPHLSQRAQTCPSAKQHASRLSAAAANRRGTPTKEAARSEGRGGRGEAGGGGQVHTSGALMALHTRPAITWLSGRHKGKRANGSGRFLREGGPTGMKVSMKCREKSG